MREKKINFLEKFEEKTVLRTASIEVKIAFWLALAFALTGIFQAVIPSIFWFYFEKYGIGAEKFVPVWLTALVFIFKAKWDHNKDLKKDEMLEELRKVKEERDRKRKLKASE